MSHEEKKPSQWTIYVSGKVKKAAKKAAVNQDMKLYEWLEDALQLYVDLTPALKKIKSSSPEKAANETIIDIIKKHL